MFQNDELLYADTWLCLTMIPILLIFMTNFCFEWRKEWMARVYTSPPPAPAHSLVEFPLLLIPIIMSGLLYISEANFYLFSWISVKKRASKSNFHRNEMFDAWQQHLFFVLLFLFCYGITLYIYRFHFILSFSFVRSNISV